MLSSDSWVELKSEFDRYVNIYTEKYGQPMLVETNIEEYAGNSASQKFQVVLNNEYDYFVAWSLPQGIVSVRICDGLISQDCVVLILYDTVKLAE